MKTFASVTRRARRSGLLALAISNVIAGTAFAQSAPNETVALESGNLDTVVVTGARAAGRTVRNSAAPIDVVSTDDLLATGKGNLLEALQTLLPSLNSAARQSDVEGNIPGVQLRNLSPGYTLVLVNGKRRNNSAYTSIGTFPGQSYTDLSLIPVSAIERVEVLRDGASAIYGSDAIAGVFNVILKSSATSGGVSVEYGQTYAGDGGRTRASANQGFALGDRGFVNLSAELIDQDDAVRSLTYKDSYLIYPAVRNGQLVRLGTNNSLPAGATPNPSEATRNAKSQSNQGTNGYETRSAALNASYDLSDSLNLYGFATYASSDKSARQNFRLPVAIWQRNPALLNVYPDGFTPTIDTEETDYSVAAGLKGQLSTWEWDGSVVYNRDYFDIYTRNTANYSLTYPGAKTDFYDGRLDYSQWVGNLDVRRGFDVAAFAEPLQVSFGAEYQRENYERLAGDPDGYFGSGAEAYPSNRPEDQADASRNRKALYVGASTNVTRPWFVDLAGRYEDHSDFGDVSTGRLSTRFDFTETFGVRATVSNGFHAPGLGTQNLQITKVTPTSEALTAAVNSPVARALGATALKPEKATNYSVGFTFSPTRTFHAAVDFYQIEISDQLGRSSSIGYDFSDPANIRDPNGTPLTAAQRQTIDDLLGTAGITISQGQNYSVNYYTNIGDTRTRGVELTLESTHNVGAGKLRWTYAFSKAETDVLSLAPIPQVLQTLPNITLLTAAAAWDLRYRLPKYNQVVGLFWNSGPWNASLNVVNNGPTKRQASADITQYEVDPTYITNISAGYSFSKGGTVEIGATNLFDEYPDNIPDAALSASSRAIYTSQYASTSLNRQGGLYFARLNYKF
ncbi:TonB-dependent receptor plug domain-containing protein [Steroidobacter cummioxidans]|uniref:TonB-dependent receptor plug domain-containing protein n=1 Tax=Steroidobacter cummioxidans TaxID=1803913 RepID=UPI000E321457|nr:TonB-dependent receptor [Steroidobacter cummioxidans]